MNFLDTLISVYEHATYPIVIKTVIPVDERFMKILYFHLQKYKAVEISEPVKTILHKHPQDFGHLEYAEVYVIKAKLKLPAAPHILRNELASLLKIPLEDIVVKTEYEGIEQNHEFLNVNAELDKKAAELGLQKGSNLSTNPNYRDYESPIPHEFMAGNSFIENFKKYEAEKMKNMGLKQYRSEGSDKLFSWLFGNEPTSKYENDYNSVIPDAPKIYPKDKNYDTPEEEIEVEKAVKGNWGNFWRKVNYSKSYKNDKGEEVELYYVPDAIEMLRKKYKK